MTRAFQNVESEYQTLQQQLTLEPLPGNRLRLIQQFIEQDDGGSQAFMFLSYYHELAAEFLELIIPENLRYRSIATLDGFLKVCHRFKNKGVMKSNQARLTSAIDILERQWLEAQLARRDLTPIHIKYHLSIPSEDLPDSERPMDDLDQLMEVASTQNPDLFSRLEKIRVEWQSTLLGSSIDRIWIPLVEHHHLGQSSELQSATIQPLQVEVELRAKDASGDLIFFNNHPLDKGDLFYDQAQDAVSLARKLLRSQNRKHPRYFRVLFGFPSKEYFYTGESFGLGMSLVVLAQMERLTIQRDQHSIHQNVVITGGVDINGQVREVSPASLPGKIDTFARSPFSVLVGPKGQIHSEPVGDFEGSCLTPGKITIGVDHIQELLKDHRVVERKRIPFRTWAREHIRRTVWYQGLQVLLPLLLAVMLGWYFTRDLNPVTLELHDTILTALNARQEILWTYPIVEDAEEAEFESDDFDRRTRSLVHDLDGDGLNEIIYSLVSQNAKYGGHLICLSSEGELLWDTDCGESAVFGSELYPPPYLIKTLKVVPGTGDTTLFLAVLNHHPWFPSKLMLITEYGDIEGTYYHGGHISNTAFIDLTGDGHQDLLFGGTNNENRDAVLGALEFSRIEGHSPQQKAAYRHSGSAEANHLFYYRFPKGDWVDLGQKSRNFTVWDIDLAGTGFGVTVANRAIGYFVIYNFDQGHHFEGAYLTDSLVDNFLNATGKHIYDIYSAEVIRSHVNKLQAWNGMSWEPVVE